MTSRLNEAATKETEESNTGTQASVPPGREAVPQPDLPTPAGLGPHGVPDLRFAMSYETPVVEATRVMLDYLDALCQRDLKGMAELLLVKQRNGPTGRVNLVFLREFTKFENRTNDLGGDLPE